MTSNSTITIEDLITCSLCKKPFETPCSLSCSHTYCRKCIEKIASVNQKQFECQQCKISTNDINSLSINQALNDLIELHASIQRSNLCANCGLTVAEYACNTCININYCLECYETVHTPPVMRRHQMLSMSEKLPELLPCKIHSKNQLEYWCHTCTAVICINCVLLKHKDHQYVMIDEVAKEFEIQVNNDLQDIQTSLKSRINQAEMLINKIDIDSKSSRLSVIEAMTLLRKTIDEHEKAMLDQISKVENEQKKQLENYKTPLKSQLQSVDIQKVTFEMLFTNKNLTKLLQSKQNFDEYVCKTNGTLKLTPLPTKTAYHLENLNQLESLQKKIIQCAKYIEVTSNSNLQLEQLIDQSQTKQELNLNSQRLNNTDMEIIANTLRTNTVLTSLNLKDSQIDGQDVRYIADALKTNETLLSLDLYNNQINKQGAQHIAEVLGINQTLTTLRLGYNQISDEGVKCLADTLAMNHTLTSLDLVSNQIGILGAQYIGEALRTNKTLMSLDLYNNQIGEEGVQHIADSLKTNQTLTSLCLRNNQIGEQGAQHFADALKTNQTLTALYLASNGIGNVGTQFLADCLMINKALTSLDIGDNQISDEGIKFLAEALKTNEKLVLLRLATNHIGDQGVQYIADALKTNRTLTSLIFESNQMSDQGVQFIAEALKTNQTLTSLDLRSNKIRHENIQWFNEIPKTNAKLTVHWW